MEVTEEYKKEFLKKATRASADIKFYVENGCKTPKEAIEMSDKKKAEEKKEG